MSERWHPESDRRVEQAAKTDQAEYWNGHAAAHWLAHEQRYHHMLQPFTRHLLDAIQPGRADAVLDVGCGSGATTFAASRCVGDEGTVLGVDISQQLIERARLRAEELDVGCVRFERADAQDHAFDPGRFDSALSRFGVMFFADPIAGFSNIRRALRPEGRLAFVCWQGLLSNEWMTVPGAVLLSYAVSVDTGPPDMVGPFALADSQLIREILTTTGFVDVAIEPLHEQLLVGHDPREAVEFFKDTGPGRRMLDGLDPDTVARCTDALAEAFSGHRSKDGISLGSAAWLVTGTSART